ncbi:hypothetical protein [Cellulomonas fimi]|uniref:Uncharacterized protein n=1 Tax=Cellulomonas fimi (strain ATCC 484 / DSM 20113 / JCM 1341 / CCUG 24087 / LMG 16345 / NBRC 15513 / NCIMB 8980 / NCTC 7547 / NRS-133) TaxID=590998 RepID=F4H4R1_CELFA|nr:hypothetical protein [Cellulomonas fimi]AEE44262.1 hypothetical protein Celf_0112 [Cellulomonas fimi ATCC 484]NNH05709.1 hypothetical protein [Cellulomonas fimi]VEH25993.1 Uncharacterised protein [Cellulomonas fimi]
MAEAQTVAPTAGYPWVRVTGWTALLLAAVSGVGVLAAGAYVLDGLADPSSWGPLVAAFLLLWSCVPAVLALPVGIWQARRRLGPAWRSRATVALAAPALLAALAVLVAGAVQSLLP